MTTPGTTPQGRPLPVPASAADAVVLVSFGGPDGPDDVLPFLRNVTRGREVPDERLQVVAQHYLARGGRSPINDQNRALVAALQAELARRGRPLPVLWGNRNWRPYLSDTLREAAQAGHRRLRVVTTSAYPSYSGCRQYRENLADAVHTLAAEGVTVEVELTARYGDAAGFVQANADALRAALAALDEAGRVTAEQTRVLFVTHSIPVAMAQASGPDGDGYVAAHLRTAARIWDDVSAARPGMTWELVYCSRSGPPTQPWLEPDVNDRLVDLAAEGVGAVVVAPIGFVSDHMEVVQDLDTEAAATAARLGLRFARAATAGVYPAHVAGLADLIEGPATWCRPGCCPNPRDPGRAAVCERR